MAFELGYGGADFTPVEGARAAFKLGDAGAVREMLERSRGARTGRRTTADQTVIEAGLAALEGRRAESRSLFLDALRRYRDLGLAWMLANAGLEAIIANVLEPAERQRVADEVRDILTRLGAVPYLAELDAALTAAPPVASRSSAAVEVPAPIAD